MRVEVKPEMLRWARERSGKTTANLTGRFPKFEQWERSECNPTLKQLESFAKATHVPIGYLFLPEPPVETVPIPDFRTIGNEYIGHSSPDLLDTIYICQQRQEWYRDFARSMGEAPFSFVGSADLKSDIIATAADIRHSLKFDVEERKRIPTWTEALRRFIEQTDDFGVMVMVSGVVGSNNRRKLEPEEFRGFALTDNLAPLVFINGADTKAAQMFTLAHELAHLWLGESALSDINAAFSPSNEVEIWCNQVAAEILVPLSMIEEVYQPSSYLNDEVNRLAHRFKVSTLVILRRIHDVGGLTREEFWDAFNDELERLRALSGGSGGNFYLTQAARVSKRFARALVISTLEGQTLYRDARQLLGFVKYSTFQELGHSLGVL